MGGTDPGAAGWRAVLASGVRHEVPELAARVVRSMEGSALLVLLDEIARREGEDCLLRIGDAGVSTWLEHGTHADLIASDELDLVEKCEALQRALGVPDEVGVRATATNELTWQPRGTPPGGLQSRAAIVLAGCLLGLLRTTGCQGLELERPKPSDTGGGAFLVHWDSFVPRRATAGADPPLPPTAALLARLIDGDVRRPWTLARVAGALEVPPRTLQRRLRREQATFSQVLWQCRLRAAAQLLAHTALSIAEVSDAAGFSDAPHLVRRFRAAFDETPARWREHRAGARPQPVERDGFVGRAQELEELTRWVAGPDRLLTVIGPGGSGKTRLARAAMRQLRQPLAGDAAFVDLREARSEAGICRAVARDLDIPVDGDAVVQIGWALDGRGPTLIVLDNLEQCVDFLPTTLGRWLDVAGRARFLCTSRVRLALAGERLLELGPLPLEAAVRLFVDRAPTEIPARDLADVRSVVEVLECMPLAVELAAGRAGAMSVADIGRRLEPRLLSGGRRDLDARHRSMQACLQWSWELLSEPARRAIAQLSVCRGGFDLVTAEAVVHGAEDRIADALLELVDASMLQFVPSTRRFSMLRLVRTFASEHLHEPDAVEARHGAWFARCTPSSDDLDNLIVACQRAQQRPDAETAARCAVGAWQVLQARGPINIGLQLLEGAQGCPGADEPALAAALVEALVLVGRLDEARALADRCLPVLRARGDRLARAMVVERCIAIAAAIGNPRGEPHLDGALILAREAGSASVEAKVLRHIAVHEFAHGRPEQGVHFFGQALDLSRTEGDAHLEGLLLGELGGRYVDHGQPERARRCLTDAHSLFERRGQQRLQGRVQSELGTLAWTEGRLRAAGEHYERALRLLEEVGDRWIELDVRGRLASLYLEQGRSQQARRHLQLAATGLETLHIDQVAPIVERGWAVLAREKGDLEHAQRHLEAALQLCQQVRDRGYEGALRVELAWILTLRQAHGAAQAEVDRAMGTATELGDHEVRAACLHLLGERHRLAGDLDAARASLDEAEQAVRLMPNNELLGRVHCSRAQVELDGAQVELASRLIVRARRYADALDLEPPAPLRRRLHEVQQRLDATRASR